MTHSPRGLSSAPVSGLQELAEGLWVSQTPLWQTNALLARSGSDALLCDPCYTPDEIEHLVARAREGQGPIHLLLTHGDFDHTCGIGFVPEAVVVAGASTAARIASGTAEEELVAAGAEWGVTWPDGLRVDRVVEAGAFECGAFRVEAIEATDLPFCVGVQWHPENFWRTGEFLPLFRLFAAACQQRTMAHM